MTKVIEIKTIESDMKYWAACTVKELVSVSNYLTENEIYMLSDQDDFWIPEKTHPKKSRLTKGEY